MSAITKVTGVAVGVCLVAFGGCVSKRESEKDRALLGASISNVINNVAVSMSGGRDLRYVATAFHYKNDRWPKDYAELQRFVQESNGYLYMRAYSDVELTNGPADRLEISFPSKMGRARLTLEAPSEK
jgi:hypothetical protein